MEFLRCGGIAKCWLFSQPVSDKAAKLQNETAYKLHTDGPLFVSDSSQSTGGQTDEVYSALHPLH